MSAVQKAHGAQNGTTMAKQEEENNESMDEKVGKVTGRDLAAAYIRGMPQIDTSAFLSLNQPMSDAFVKATAEMFNPTTDALAQAAAEIFKPMEASLVEAILGTLPKMPQLNLGLPVKPSLLVGIRQPMLYGPHPIEFEELPPKD